MAFSIGSVPYPVVLRMAAPVRGSVFLVAASTTASPAVLVTPLGTADVEVAQDVTSIVTATERKRFFSSVVFMV